MTTNHNDIVLWLARRPGVFEAPTERGCWTLAWLAFSGIPDIRGSSLGFMMTEARQARSLCCKRLHPGR